MRNSVGMVAEEHVVASHITGFEHFSRVVCVRFLHLFTSNLML
jgi:hypothetical protein